MKRIRFALLACLVAAPLFASGCVAASRSYHEEPTLGQELMDLKEAYDRGAMTEQDYELAKHTLIKKAG